MVHSVKSPETRDVCRPEDIVYNYIPMPNTNKGASSAKTVPAKNIPPSKCPVLRTIPEQSNAKIVIWNLHLAQNPYPRL